MEQIIKYFTFLLLILPIESAYSQTDTQSYPSPADRVKAIYSFISDAKETSPNIIYIERFLESNGYDTREKFSKSWKNYEEIFCSSSLNRLMSKMRIYDKQQFEAYPGYIDTECLDYDIWYQQDLHDETFVFKKIEIVFSQCVGKHATVVINIVSGVENDVNVITKRKATLSLIYERNNWYIDNISCSYRRQNYDVIHDLRRDIIRCLQDSQK